MNLDEYNFNVPAFVRSASPDKFDADVADAVVVGGYRIDNPAAAWVAGAAVRKMANMFDMSMCRLIKQACDLFGVTDTMFTPIEVKSSVTVSDGVHTADFCIFDNETLNKAASDLLGRRASLPYEFAHDCAVALQDEASKQKLSFDSELIVPIRKLAGDYNVDFTAGRKLLESAVSVAKDLNMTEHAEVLSKIASMCTEDCSPSAAPYFIVALDEFYRSVPSLKKRASADGTMPEDVFYMSTAEFHKKADSQKVDIDSEHSITKSALSSATGNISKWAAACGYSISPDADPNTVASVVAAMPSALRDEFVELFA